MAAEDRVVGAPAVGRVEPRHAAGRAALGRALRSGRAELHAPFRRDEAHARHRIHHHAQAVPAGEVVAPGIRFRAPHVGEEVAVVRRAERRRNLVGQRLRLGDIPARQQAGMHHRPFALDVEQRQGAQPAEQFVPVWRGEDGFERVLLVGLAEAGGLHDQMQVVVAEDADGRSPEPFHEAQHLERLRPAIDEVADEPEPVRVGRKADVVEQPLERVEAALQVADRIGGHLWGNTAPNFFEREKPAEAQDE